MRVLQTEQTKHNHIQPKETESLQDTNLQGGTERGHLKCKLAFIDSKQVEGEIPPLKVAKESRPKKKRQTGQNRYYHAD